LSVMNLFCLFNMFSIPLANVPQKSFPRFVNCEGGGKPNSTRLLLKKFPNFSKHPCSPLFQPLLLKSETVKIHETFIRTFHRDLRVRNHHYTRFRLKALGEAAPISSSMRGCFVLMNKVILRPPRNKPRDLSFQRWLKTSSTSYPEVTLTFGETLISGRGATPTQSPDHQNVFPNFLSFRSRSS
jgi:hypothetical protein